MNIFLDPVVIAILLVPTLIAIVVRIVFKKAGNEILAIAVAIPFTVFLLQGKRGQPMNFRIWFDG
jgi:hypothetical protein